MNFDDLQKLYKELVKEDIDISSENIKELYKKSALLKIQGLHIVHEIS